MGLEELICVFWNNIVVGARILVTSLVVTQIKVWVVGWCFVFEET